MESSKTDKGTTIKQLNINGSYGTESPICKLDVEGEKDDYNGSGHETEHAEVKCDRTGNNGVKDGCEAELDLNIHSTMNGDIVYDEDAAKLLKDISITAANNDDEGTELQPMLVDKAPNHTSEVGESDVDNDTPSTDDNPIPVDRDWAWMVLLGMYVVI